MLIQLYIELYITYIDICIYILPNSTMSMGEVKRTINTPFPAPARYSLDVYPRDF